jgi:hypothetical protein
MTFKEFKTATDYMIEHHNKVTAAYKLNIDLIEFSDTQEKLLSMLWDQILTDKGKDWLDWFMYEKDYIEDGKGRKEMEAWDDDGHEICKDLKGLHTYLTTQKYFKCLK